MLGLRESGCRRNGNGDQAPSDVSGTVWKLIAQPGDVVEAEAEIAIIRSMKMEIPVLAPRAGKLAGFLVAEGEAVTEGQAIGSTETPKKRAEPPMSDLSPPAPGSAGPPFCPDARMAAPC